MTVTTEMKIHFVCSAFLSTTAKKCGTKNVLSKKIVSPSDIPDIPFLGGLTTKKTISDSFGENEKKWTNIC